MPVRWNVSHVKVEVRSVIPPFGKRLFGHILLGLD